MTKPLDRTEAFKTALSAATRAIAGDDEVTVDYSVDGGRLAGHAITLTTPPREITSLVAARARGQADALALRLAHHDAVQHARLAPRAEEPRKLFEAAERARVESIGAAAMDGVAENLDAALQQRCERAGYDRVSDKSRAPIEDALEFLLRETLTGRALRTDRAAPKAPRIGILRVPDWSLASPAMVEAVNTALRAAEKAGATLVELGGGAGAEVLEAQVADVSRRGFWARLPVTAARLLGEQLRLEGDVDRFEADVEAGADHLIMRLGAPFSFTHVEKLLALAEAG
jgi:hypothetical protein